MSYSIIVNKKIQPRGEIQISGAKNSATRLLAAATICDHKIMLKNFPTTLVDANHKKNFIRNNGGFVEFDVKKKTAEISAENYTMHELPDYNYPVRTTYLLAAGMLKRDGIARIPYPGGCKIGSRGYDLHVYVWEEAGCKVEEKPDYLEITCRKLKPFKINFPVTTIGGTENALITGACIPGESIIRNAYVSPEVEDLIHFLRTLGSEIELTGNSLIKIRGLLNPRGTSFTVMPDRIEALTWMVMAAISEGDLLIKDVPFNSMEIPLVHLKEAGIDIFRNSASAIINRHSIQQQHIQPFEVACGTHPGVISDMQPFYTLLALKADGKSKIYDYRYPERMQYLEELSKFCPGAIEWKKGVITVRGPVDFIGTEATSTDLRGSMALIMAALTAKGESKINKAEMAMRGYNDLDLKLTNIGYAIDVISEKGGKLTHSQTHEH